MISVSFLLDSTFRRRKQNKMKRNKFANLETVQLIRMQHCRHLTKIKSHFFFLARQQDYQLFKQHRHYLYYKECRQTCNRVDTNFRVNESHVLEFCVSSTFEVGILQLPNSHTFITDTQCECVFQKVKQENKIKSVSIFKANEITFRNLDSNEKK